MKNKVSVAFELLSKLLIYYSLVPRAATLSANNEPHWGIEKVWISLVDK